MARRVRNSPGVLPAPGWWVRRWMDEGATREEAEERHQAQFGHRSFEAASAEVCRRRMPGFEITPGAFEGADHG